MIKHFLDHPPVNISADSVGIRPISGIQIRSIRQADVRELSIRYEVDAEFTSDYSLPVQETVHVAVYLKDLALARGQFQVRDWIIKDTLDRLSDDFFPTWAPI